MGTPKSSEEETDLLAEISALDEATLFSVDHYDYLKKLCERLLSLGTSLCLSMTQHPDPLNEPLRFPDFLKCALLFAKHPSMLLSQKAQTLWLNILHSSHLSKSSSVLNVIPALLKCEIEKLLKVGYPLKTNSGSCKFSSIDFHSYKDFEKNFSKYHSDVEDVLRHAINILPKSAFALCKELLSSLMNGNDWKEILGSSCSELDEKLCWNAMATYVEVICCLVKDDLNNFWEFSADGLEMITMCKNLTTKDPVVLSYTLSSMTSLFIFYTFSEEKNGGLEVLDKILAYFMAPKEDFANLRQQACTLLIKLSCNHPTLLLLQPMFDEIWQSIQTLLDRECLNKFEKCSLLEFSIILSNSLQDYNRHYKFLAGALSSFPHTWDSPAVIAGIKSPEAFIRFSLGEDSSDLKFAVNILKVIANRSTYQSDPEEAKEFHLKNHLAIRILQNPASHLVTPLLIKVIQLLRTLCEVNDPRKTILGIINEMYPDNLPTQKEASDLIKKFAHGLYEGCLSILCDSMRNLGIDFYKIENLRTILKESLFFKMECMSSYNMKSLIPTLYGKFMFVLEIVCKFMYQKLSVISKNFEVEYGKSVGDHDHNHVEETKVLARDYLQFLADLLQQDKNTESVRRPSKSLTELGIKIMFNENVRSMYLTTAFGALVWSDSKTKYRAFQLCELIFHQVVEYGLVGSNESAAHLLRSVLDGIEGLGQHDAIFYEVLGFALTIYEKLRVPFPDIRKTLMSAVECSNEDIEELDKVLKNSGLKAKKKAFKNFIRKIIGLRNITSLEVSEATKQVQAVRL